MPLQQNLSTLILSPPPYVYHPLSYVNPTIRYHTSPSINRPFNLLIFDNVLAQRHHLLLCFSTLNACTNVHLRDDHSPKCTFVTAAECHVLHEQWRQWNKDWRIMTDELNNICEHLRAPLEDLPTPKYPTVSRSPSPLHYTCVTWSAARSTVVRATNSLYHPTGKLG